jgi:hypothetical protein
MTARLTLSGGKELEAALRELGTSIAGRLGNNAVRAGARVIAADAARATGIGGIRTSSFESIQGLQAEDRSDSDTRASFDRCRPQSGPAVAGPR